MDNKDQEVIAVSSSSAADTAFNAVIGSIADIVMGEEFQQLQKSFMEKHYLEFEDSEEDKPSYTAIFTEYVELLEKHLEQQLTERTPTFNMNTFMQQVMQHKEEVPGDILEMLLTFSDVPAFKKMFLEYRADKEGQGLSMSQALVVTSLTPAGSDNTGSTEPQS